MDKGIRFEESLKKLEGIVNKLEQGDLSLEESLAFFEQGMKLAKLCQGKLEAAQAKVEILTQTESGKLSAKPFQVSDEKEENQEV